jgi:hypothetical protein
MGILLNLIMATLVSVLFAAECATVNLITEEESPFQHMPVVDQKKSNICYALSAAQLGDYYLLKNGSKGRELHPAWLALNYAIGRGRKSLDIGHVKETLDRIQGENNCSYFRVASALKGINQKDTELEILEKSPVEGLAKILSTHCLEKKEVRFPPIHRYNFRELPNSQSVENFLIGQLDLKSPLPLSISYCSKMLKVPDYEGIRSTSEGIRDVLNRDCDYHESLIVGKKEINNTCHLLLRNSWGDRWRPGNLQWTCLCRDRLSGRFEDNCLPQTHPDERFSIEACWIPSHNLSKNIGAITFIDAHSLPKPLNER